MTVSAKNRHPKTSLKAVDWNIRRTRKQGNDWKLQENYGTLLWCNCYGMDIEL